MAQLKHLKIQRKHWVYPSNILSLLRILLVPFGYASIVAHQHVWTFVLLVLVGLTDMLDGLFARRLNQITELGKILDPIADKFAVLAAIAGLIVAGSLPFWVVLPVLVRDLAILVGSWFVIRKSTFVPPSNLWGKLTTCSVALVVLVYVLPVPVLARWVVIAVMLVFVVVSFGSYARVFVEARRTTDS